jgi:hypothetical protein
MKHVEHALTAFDVRHYRRHRSNDIAGRSMERVIAAVPVNLGEHADHAVTQFTRRAVTGDASRHFKDFGKTLQLP